jgi:hypothetical protein
VNIIDPGHVYWISNLGSSERPAWLQALGAWVAVLLCRIFGGQAVVFIKRSSDMVHHHNQHPGSNTQEYFRVTIDRTEYLNDLGDSLESQDAVWHLQMALWCYEARAWRRKQQKLNKSAVGQAAMGDVDATRDGWSDVPFGEFEIEMLPTGPDGHIILSNPTTEDIQ